MVGRLGVGRYSKEAGVLSAFGSLLSALGAVAAVGCWLVGAWLVARLVALIAPSDPGDEQ